MTCTSVNEVPALVNPQPFIELLRAEGGVDIMWSDEELPELWRRQLQASLVDEFKPIGPAAALIAQSVGANSAPPIATFGDLFHHAAPPVELLRQVKELGKRDAVNPEPLLPKPIATALYHISILLARTLCHTSIASLPDARLIEAIRWLAGQAWLDATTEQLLRRLARRLGAEFGPTGEAGSSSSPVDFA